MTDTQLRELFARHDPAAEPPLPPHFLADSLDHGHRAAKRRRVVRTVATSGIAAVVALAIAGGVVVAGDHHPAAQVQQEAAPADAATLLGRISLAASEQKIAVRDDQFVYTRHQVDLVFPLSGKGGKLTVTRVMGVTEDWVSADGSMAGWGIGPDKLGGTAGWSLAPNTEPTLEAPTYKYLTTLPTDPDGLLAMVRASVKAKEGLKPHAVTDPDQAAFEVLGGLIRNALLPPKLGAAVYRAAAKIPGVTVVKDATDVTGRHGVAVFRASKSQDASSEWIFDKKTYDFLGERSVLKPGTDESNVAVITRAVVDKVRQAPK